MPNHAQISSGEPRLGRYFWTTVALALAGTAELAVLFFIQTLLPKLAADYTIPVSQVSIILSAETGLLAIGLLFTGSLADRYGRKSLIISSLVGGAILTLLCPFANSWTVLVIMRAATGFVLSGIAAAAAAYISEEVEPVFAGVVTGYFVFGNSIGGMGGRVIASQLMDHVSINTIFVLFGVILLVSALLVSVALPASKHFKQAPNLNMLALIWGGIDHFRNRKVAGMFLVSFIIFGSFTAFYNFLAFNLHREPFNLSYASAGLVSICFVLSFISAPQAGRLATKFGSMNVLTGLLVMMAVGILLTAVALNVPFFVIGAVLFTAGFFGCHSIGLSWVSKNVTHGRGQATAFYLFFYYMGGSVIGYVNGLVFVHFDWNGLCLFLIVLLCIGMVIARLLNRYASGNASSAAPVQTALPRR